MPTGAQSTPQIVRVLVNRHGRREACRVLKISNGYLTRLLQGGREPGHELVSRIAEAAGCVAEIRRGRIVYVNDGGRK